jgi:hypothetical protein
MSDLAFIIAGSLAVIGAVIWLIWWSIKRSRNATPAPTSKPTAIPQPAGPVGKRTQLMANAINNLDWNVRSCEAGEWLLRRLAAQAITKGPFACNRVFEVLNTGAVVSAFPGTNEVTRVQITKDLTDLVSQLADEVCIDGAVTGQQLADAINGVIKETCDPRTGTLAKLYIPATSKIRLPL